MEQQSIEPSLNENIYQIDVNSLVEVTDQLEIKAYVYKDPQFKMDTLLLKISGKYVKFNDVGYNVGVGFSPRVLEHLEYPGKNKIEDNSGL